MTFLDLFRAEINRTGRPAPFRDLSEEDAAPFSAAISTRSVRDRLSPNTFMKTPRAESIKRGVIPWAGTTPVLGALRRPKPARGRSTRLGGRSRPRLRSLRQTSRALRRNP